MTRTRRLLTFSLLAGLAGAVALWAAGTVLIQPAPAAVGPLPEDLAGETIRFASASGSDLAAWSVPGSCACGSVVLLHGVRANRGALVGRARVLHDAGYSVLAVDLQAHGESGGEHITFGALERLDAIAAVAQARRRFPNQPVGVVGVSLGGAAAALAADRLGADAVVLEAVYTDIETATRNRLRMRLGRFGAALAPALTFQLPLRTGVEARSLRPVEAIAHLGAPVLVVAGERDAHTTPADSRALFDAAQAPKELWWVRGAAHVNVLDAAPAAYRERVLGFFRRYL